MAYPVVQYWAASGSDTSPLSAIATGASGDMTGSSIVFNENINVSATAANDGSDYLWYEASAGDRHLFQINSFDPDVSSCSGVTVHVSGVTRTGSNWAINGIRQTFENDTSNPDLEDLDFGWIGEFDSGTYSATNTIELGINAGTVANTSPSITLRAASGAASRPVIDCVHSSYMLRPQAGNGAVVKGLKFTTTTGTGTSTYVYCNGNSLTLDDCVFDVGATPLYGLRLANEVNIVRNCYITGGSTHGIHSNTHSSVFNTVIDGQDGTYHSTAGLYFDGGYKSTNVTNCLIKGSAGDGIYIDLTSDTSSRTFLMGNTVVACGGEGIIIIGSVGDLRSNGIIMNNVVVYNTGVGISDQQSDYNFTNWIIENNVSYGNTAGEYDGDFTSENNTVITSDPFNNYSAGDYTLNTDAGGGALVRKSGYPSSLPGGA